MQHDLLHCHALLGDAATRAMLDVLHRRLRPVHVCTLGFLMRQLHHLVAHQRATHRLDARGLAVVFAACLFGCEPEHETSMHAMRRVREKLEVVALSPITLL